MVIRRLLAIYGMLLLLRSVCIVATALPGMVQNPKFSLKLNYLDPSRACIEQRKVEAALRLHQQQETPISLSPISRV